MNIKIQLVVTIMCLASFSVRAQVSLNNANTVEALIGAYPDMPSAGTLGAVYLQSESAMESVQVFHDKLSQIRDRYKVITDASDEKAVQILQKVWIKNCVTIMVSRLANCRT